MYKQLTLATKFGEYRDFSNCRQLAKTCKR